MPSYSKRKGAQFEMEAVKMLTLLIKDSEWKRVPGSGAMGTSLGIPLLFSDIVGKVKNFRQKFRVEAKAGYGGAQQFTMRKEWLDKILEEAKSTYSFPFLIGKYSGAREGSRVFVVLDVNIFASLINEYTDMQKRLDEQTTEMDNNKKEII